MRATRQKTKTTKKKTTEKNKKKAAQPKFNPAYPPEGISLEEWQIGLRRQAAEKAPLAIRPMEPKQFFGDFEVVNPLSSRKYKVAFRGMESDWNYCSCPDFKTSGLGTCKHVEAVRLHLQGKRKRFPKELIPSYTSVYLSYKGGRSVRIRIGEDHQEAFKALAEDFFSPDGVLMEESFARFSEFLHKAQQIDDRFRCYSDAMQYIIDVRDRSHRHRLIDTKYPDGKLDGLLRTTLYPYQEEGILFATRAGRSIIADEMGLGKTIQAIGAAELMEQEFGIASVLILCPTSLKYQWKKEIERFTGKTALVVEGNHLKRREQYALPDFYKIVSYQSAANDIKAMKTLQADLVIMDEAQRLKNWNTQIAQAAKRLQSDFMIILSGTPLENKLEELYAIAQYIDQYALGPYYRFMHHHRVVSESGKTIGYKDLNRVGEMLKDVLIRRRKSQVNIQLPSRVDKILFVPMTIEQLTIHNECKQSLASLVLKWQRMRFLSENDRRRLLLLMGQMRMVCDSTFILDQSSRYDTKIGELMDILSEVFDAEDGKVVVFSQWERMTRLVAAELDEMGVGYEYLHGGVPSVKRKDLIDNFTDDPSSRVFLSTDAGSTGLNLQSASLVINLDLPWNPAVLEQRIARVHRMGQKQNIQVINMVSTGTIEENMLTTLNFKSSLFEGVLDEGADTVFLEESKFNKLMHTVEEITRDTEGKETVATGIDREEVEKRAETVDQPATINGSPAEKLSPTALSASETSPEEPSPVAFSSAESSPEESFPAVLSSGKQSADNQPVEKQLSDQQPAELSPQELISQGIGFIGAFAQALSSPEKTRELVDSLVEEDEATGRTALRIPVPDKETVANVLNVFGKLIHHLK